MENAPDVIGGWKDGGTSDALGDSKGVQTKSMRRVSVNGTNARRTTYLSHPHRLKSIPGDPPEPAPRRGPLSEAAFPT